MIRNKVISTPLAPPARAQSALVYFRVTSRDQPHMPAPLGWEIAGTCFLLYSAAADSPFVGVKIWLCCSKQILAVPSVLVCPNVTLDFLLPLGLEVMFVLACLQLESKNNTSFGVQSRFQSSSWVQSPRTCVFIPPLPLLPCTTPPMRRRQTS